MLHMTTEIIEEIDWQSIKCNLFTKIEMSYVRASFE